MDNTKIALLSLVLLGAWRVIQPVVAGHPQVEAVHREPGPKALLPHDPGWRADCVRSAAASERPAAEASWNSDVAARHSLGEERPGVGLHRLHLPLRLELLARLLQLAQLLLVAHRHPVDLHVLQLVQLQQALAEMT